MPQVTRIGHRPSTNAAKLFGLYPQKGTVAVGSDVDLVIWDVETSHVVNGAAMQSQAGYSVYEAREVQGWPAHTIGRGEIVFEHGDIMAPRGCGRWLRRRRMMMSVIVVHAFHSRWWCDGISFCGAIRTSARLHRAVQGEQAEI